MKRRFFTTVIVMGCLATTAAAVPPAGKSDGAPSNPRLSASADPDPVNPLQVVSDDLKVVPAPKISKPDGNPRADDPGTPHRPVDNSGVGVAIFHYEFEGKPYRKGCTATNISVGGKNVVMLARHCLPGRKGKPRPFYGWFIPGANYAVDIDSEGSKDLWVDQSPLGVFPIKAYASFLGFDWDGKFKWTDLLTDRQYRMFENDLALMAVGTNEKGQELYDLTGDVSVDLGEQDRYEQPFAQGYPLGWRKSCHMAETTRRMGDNLHQTSTCEVADSGMSGASVMTREGLHFDANDIMTNARAYGVFSAMSEGKTFVSRLDRRRFWALLDDLKIDNRWPENSSPDKVGFTPIPSYGGKRGKLDDCPLIPRNTMKDLLGGDDDMDVDNSRGRRILGMDVTGRSFGCNIFRNGMVPYGGLSRADVSVLHLDPEHRNVDIRSGIIKVIESHQEQLPGKFWFATEKVHDLPDGVTEGVRMMMGPISDLYSENRTTIYYRRGDEIFAASASYSFGSHHEAAVKDLIDQAVRSSRVLSPRPQ